MSTRRLLPFGPLLMLLLGVLPGPLGPARAALAKDASLSPAKIQQIKKARKSYDTCRKEALGQLKQGGISKKKFEVALNACKENFPGADLYITCKKQAIHAAQSHNVAEDQAIEQCKRYLTATQFDPDEPVPFFVEAGQIYFSGIGLNRSLPTKSLTPPNFECDKLQANARNPAQAQYLLFGNHPRTFAGLSEAKGPALMKTLKLTKPSAKGVDVAGFGRVFGDPKGTSGTVFFPTASCDFNAEPGDTFAGLSAYYLLDVSGSAVTPYFGIAYYKADQTTVTTQKLVQALIHTLGQNFKSFNKNSNVTFVAAASVAETDDEKDPKNLCKQPRQHRFVGVVQGRKDDPGHPEYLLLANVKNLCDFGDRLGKRLVE